MTEARDAHGGTRALHRSPQRWRTHFGQWVGAYGVRRLTGELSTAGRPVTENAVYKWVAGTTVPRPEHAVVIVEASCGQVSLEDVYRHRGCMER